MVEALIAGERDGNQLATLAKGKLRPRIPQLAQALNGHFGSHHALVCGQILQHLDTLKDSIAKLDGDVAERIEPFRPAMTLLLDVPGLQRLSAEVVIAETGADMSRFPTAGHLASWAGLCPGNHESGGKRRRVSTPPGNRWLRRTLIESARAAARTRGSYFGAQYHQIAHRRGPNKAAVAVAHSLAVVIWHLLSTGARYEDLGNDYFRCRRDPERQKARLVHQLQDLGYTVTLDRPVGA
jgi:transposase